jgi:glutathione S-transferase
MSISFYCGSGSPYAWRVWLALEHKQLAYDLKMLSFSAGDLSKVAHALFAGPAGGDLGKVA